MNKKIEILARAVILNRGKILVCKNVNKSYYYFPGGHVESGESAEEALKRELKEELGLIIKKYSFIGGSEHKFSEDGAEHHEINLVFYAPTKIKSVESKEDHIRFYLLDKRKIARGNILPIILKKAILKWLKDRKPFWANEI